MIVPLVAGIGDADDELYTLNETGRAVWTRLDGKKTLGEIATLLLKEYEAGDGAISESVLGFASALVDRGILSVV
ncbi:MAG TPA: PqqD family protein [Rectinemataceae bacterium]|nr:PqqD family protein [Rectinemataceae bacterium]